MAHPNNGLSLVADIGGTNTRCALADGSHVLQNTVKRYKNADHADLEQVLCAYLASEGNVIPAAACVAAAGPVNGGVATMTNLDWVIDSHTLTQATNAKTVAIMNDLQAQGHALHCLEQSTLRPILHGTESGTDPQAVRLVVGLGTGFNTALVLETPEGRFVPPSETGHINLPTTTDQELRLSNFISGKHGFAAAEDILSGRGLEDTYQFLTEEAGDPHKATAQNIMAACETGRDIHATQAAALFTQILGTVCGNLALIQLPFGGIYLVGGVARAFAPYLNQFGFHASFTNKGRFTDFMSNFTVHVVEDDYAALTGAATYITSLGKAASRRSS